MQDITPSLFHCYHHSAFKHECSAITGLLQHSHQVIHIIVNKLTVDLDHVSPKRNHRLLSGTIWKEKARQTKVRLALHDRKTESSGAVAWTSGNSV